MFVSYQKNYAVPLVIYEHVYEVSSLYDIGKLGFQNPCFSTDSREIYRRACLITLQSNFEIFQKKHPAVEVMLDRRIFER